MATFIDVLQMGKFIACFLALFYVNWVVSDSSHTFHEFFLCRKCGREILETVDIINVPSKLALRVRNDTVGHKPEVLLQLFKNPNGMVYEVITASKADVYRASQETGGDTWWSGYNWIILGCPQCRQHVGWEYMPSDKTNKEQKSFYGLVLDNLLFENDAENLIVLPKSYMS